MSTGSPQLISCPGGQQMFDAALACVRAGISVIPIAPDGSKRPAYSLLPVVEQLPGSRPRRGWKELCHRLPTEDELRQWYLRWGPVCGMAAICGAVSGKLELIDFDSADAASPWLGRMQSEAPELLEKLILVQTPRPGLHAYYRCSEIEGNQKLAQTMQADTDSGELKVVTLIETRGEGGYALTSPSPPHCHPTGRTYICLSQHGLPAVQTLEPSERAILLEISRSFHQIPERSIRSRTRPVLSRPQQIQSGRPGDDFNARGDWGELLERNGWAFVSVDSDGKEYWCRPGKSEGTSATVNHAHGGRLHVFTSNAEPLEQDTSYTKFAFVAIVEHGGDFAAASRYLQSLGYGQGPLVNGARRRRRSGRRQGGRRQTGTAPNNRRSARSLRARRRAR